MAGEADAAAAQWQDRTSLLATRRWLRSQHRDDESVGGFYELRPCESGTQGLVVAPKDWEWSSARWYEGERDVKLRMDATMSHMMA